ncbi:MAG: gliding motility-associated C-terminal domain-containing protein [Bacteroidetes bacterium]|nr:gliding motility-associated C-terminal domain-containing protein [Bacteroidota bacterium]
MKKIYLFISILILSIYSNNVLAQGNTCSQATPFCTAVGDPFTYQNVTGSSVGQTGPNYGCLGSEPRPSWFYVKTSAAGAMTYSLTQSTTPGGAPNLDVDYICWGPFTAAQFSTTACSNLTAANTVGCSYSAAATETMTINSTGAGQYYIIMITNYNGGAGYITFTQTGGPGSDCSITCPTDNFTLNGSIPSGTTSVALPNASTVTCNQSITLSPPNVATFTNPYTDINTPCIKVNFNPFVANLNTNGGMYVYEGNAGPYWQACPSGCGGTIGGTSATAGNGFNWYLTGADPSLSHQVVLCKGSGAIGTTTVTVENCWDNTVVGGPYVWTGSGAASCYTINIPANTAIGTATYNIVPSSGSPGLYDSNWGPAVITTSLMPAGTTYTVNYVFNNGVCNPITGHYTLTIAPNPTITAISSQTVCSGSPVAAINFTTTPSGASVAWTNNNTSVGIAASGSSNIAGYTAPVVASTQTGIISAVATQSACTSATQTLAVVINPKPTVSTSVTQTVTCTTPNVVITGSGGGTYNWSGPGITGGGSTATPTVNLGGTYNVTVTSAAGCTNTASASVAQNNTPPSPTASNSATLTCTTTTVALSGGPASGVTYQWSGPGFSGGTTSQNAVATAAGTYTLKVTDAVNGCTATAVTTVSQNTTTPAPTATNAATLSCTTSTVQLNGGPAAGVTYQWSGPGFSGGTTSQNAIATAAGTYTLKVTNSVSGCTATANTTVVQNTTTPSPTATNAATLTCTTSTVQLNGGPAAGVTYQWSGPGFSGGTTSQNAVATAAGTYTLKVTDAVNGCTATAVTTVSQNTTAPSPTATNAATLSCTTTTVALNGGPAAGVTYQWSGPGFSGGTTSQNAVATAAGTYTLKVTGTANSCTAAAVTTVAQNTTTPSPTATNSATLTCTTTTVALNGGPAAGVTYQWSGPGFSGGTTSQNAVANAAGTYTLKVTDAVSGCTATAMTTVSQNTTTPLPSITIPSTLTCTSPTITLSGTPASGVTYTWTGPGIVSGGNTASPSVNQPGSYGLTVTNSVSGCTATVNTTVTQNTITPSVTMPLTQTITCASPTVSLAGSATPSTCTPVWTGGVCAGSTSYTASACSPSTYTLTVTDPANGCTKSGTVSVVSSSGLPTVSSSNSGSITCTNTSAQVVATTTSSPVSYSWTGPGSITGATQSTATVTTAGNYTCVVTNTLTGCSSTVTTSVPINTTAVTASIAPTSSITCTTTSLTLNASPASGSYTYSWTPAAGLTGTAVATPTVTQGGNYSVVITNTVNGCTGNANVTVPSNTTIPTVSVSPGAYTISCASPTVQLSVTSSDPAVTYSWTAPGTGSLNNSTIQNPIGSGVGVFTVVVTSTVSGCSSALSSAATATIVANAAIPTISLSATSLSVTCSQPSPSAVVTSTDSPLSYSWSPSPASGANTASPTFTAAGNYSVVVTNTSNGCYTNGNVTVAMDNTVPGLTVTPTQSLTCNTPTAVISTTVNPASGINYSWTGGTVTGATTSSVSVNQAGNYDVLVTNPSNGCTVSATSTIVDNTTIPTTTVSPTSYTISCASPTVQLTVNSSDPAVTYSWTPPSTGSVSNPTIQNPVASGTGVFTVVVTNSVTGCSSAINASATATVVPDAAIPTLTLSANTVSLTCVSSTVSVVASSTNTPISYTWSPAPLSGGTTDTPVFDTPGVYTLTLSNTSNGCATTANVTVVTNTTIPTITVTPTQSLTCATPGAVISTTVNPSNVTYSWTGAGITGSSTGSSVNVNQAGNYDVLVTDAVNGCTNTATGSITGNTVSPTATISAVTSATAISCSSPSLALTVASTPSTGVTYTWTPGGANTQNISVTNAGVVNVVVMDATNGCTVAAQYTVTGSTTPPQVSAAANASIACGATSATISASSTNTNVSYSWTGPNAGSITSGANTATPTIVDAGAYVVTVTDNVTNCTSTATVNVSQSSVTAAFTANPNSGVAPLDVNFTNQSAGATAYSWTFGDGGNSTATNPSNTYNSHGTFTVMLIASAGPCADTAYATIVIEDGLSIEIPNVFTPNGDGVNDLFTIKSTGVKEISLDIFNRWGEKLYEFTGANAAWDGKTGQGAKVPDGTYFFFVKATGYDGNKVEKHGTVNLYR